MVQPDWGPGAVRGASSPQPGYGYTYNQGLSRLGVQSSAWGRPEKTPAPATSFHALLRLLERAHDEEVQGLHERLASLSQCLVPLEGELTEDWNGADRGSERLGPGKAGMKLRGHLQTRAESERLNTVRASLSKPVRDWNEALRTTSVFNDRETFGHLLGRVTTIAKVSLVFGGFWSFRSELLQRCYLSGFMLSFCVCFVTCVINWAWQTPPYFTVGTGFLTAYFHVVGLHSWWLWHSFVKDPKLMALVRGFLGDSFLAQPWEKEVRAQLRWEIRLAFALLLALQLLTVGIAVVAFCLPPVLHWYESADANDLFKGIAPARAFSLLHGLVMAGVIPQHVPTLLASTALLYIVNVFHTYDMERLRSLVIRKEMPLVEREHYGYHSCDFDGGDVVKSTDFNCEKRTARDTPQARLVHLSIVNNCCDMADDVQRRLDYTSQKVKWLWAHTLFYSTIQLTLAAHACTKKYSVGQDWDRETYFQFLLDLFHGLVGLMIFFSALLTPAFTTVVFEKSPMFLLHALTNRGVTPCVTAASMHFLHTKLIGFTTFFYARVDMASVSRFSAVVMMGSALYASSAAWEQP